MKVPSLDGGSAGLRASPPRGFPKPATGKRGRELWKPVFRQPKNWELKLSHMSGLASISRNNKLKKHKYFLALEILDIVCMGLPRRIHAPKRQKPTAGDFQRPGRRGALQPHLSSKMVGGLPRLPEGALKDSGFP